MLGTTLYGTTFSARQIMTAQRQLSEISALRALIRNLFPNLAKMAPNFFGIEVSNQITKFGLINTKIQLLASC